MKSGTDASITIEGRGWQYHLDDDPISRLYAHERLGDWKDVRSLLTADIANRYTAPGAVQTDGGAITFGWPHGAAVITARRAGIVFDAGPDPARWIKRGVFTWALPVTGISCQLWIEGSDLESQAGGAGAEVGATVDLAVTSSATTSVTFASARRYVVLYIYRNGATINPSLNDQWVRLTSAMLFSSTAYESGAASILKASDVVKDVRKTCPLLSADESKISTTAFSIRELESATARSQREWLEGVNAFHNYRLQIDVDRRIVFEAFPSSPKYQSGEWPGFDFEDASANSGEELANKVRAIASDGAGNPLVVTRYASDLPDALMRESSSVAPTNPRADVDTSGWSVSGGTLTRDTVSFASSPASIKHALIGPATISTTMTGGTFKQGRRYRLTWMQKQSSGALFLGEIRFGSTTDYGSLQQGAINPVGSGWEGPFTIEWTPLADVAASSVTWRTASNPDSPGDYQFDNLILYESQATLVDRRGFVRSKELQVNAVIDAAGLTQIADVWLGAHRTTPLRGAGSLERGGFRSALDGAPIHPAILLRDVGEVVRMTDRTDPDTGGFGRDGRIAAVSYDDTTEKASITIDNERRNFEAFLGRLAVVQGRG
jgi:hypothetical protein